ncbi:MAG: 50S ribosomal protein L25/general stress protein Ctc [Acetobacteraceae bacterium]|nr:50S ribosomal protein L25/general stress protein Ctc [Acetobacteraceae bacterium]
MANVTTIEAEARERAGKGAARATRRAGMVPAVIYGAKEAPTICQLDPRIVMRELHRGGWRSRPYQLSVGGSTVRALMREVQFHPVTDKPIHVDFQRLAAGEKIRIAVTIHFQGEATSPGIKRGGLLNVVRPAVEVLADPETVPEFFTADISGLDINSSIHWGDLQGTEGVQPVGTTDETTLATITPPTKSVEAAPEATAAAAPAKGSKAPAKAAAKK